jgi:hypothetical protein
MHQHTWNHQKCTLFAKCNHIQDLFKILICFFNPKVYLKDLEGYCFSSFVFLNLSVGFELHIPLIACTTLICRLPRSRNPIWD